MGFVVLSEMLVKATHVMFNL